MNRPGQRLRVGAALGLLLGLWACDDPPVGRPDNEPSLKRDPAPAKVEAPPAPAPAPPAAAPPALTPAERTRNAQALERAEQAMLKGNLDEAWTLLRTCVVGGIVCPEAAPLMETLEHEGRFGSMLDRAEKALAQNDLGFADYLLVEATTTRAFAKRQAALRQRSNQLRQASLKGPSAAGPEGSLLTEARVLLGRNKLPEAKKKLERCIQAAPQNPDCHLELAKVDAMLGDARGAREQNEAWHRLSTSPTPPKTR